MEKIHHFADLIHYQPIEVKESSGLVSLRLMIIMLNEACQILMESLTGMENIDEEFKVVYGQRYGIFQLADMVGIEKIVMLMEDMFNEYGDRRYKASAILWRLYYSKQLGLATKKGFYIYDEAGNIVAPNNLN
jgi:3-hydroxybutyryl-CoA dehydrogenase